MSRTDIHVIIDFMFLYYKYKFMLQASRIKQLSGLSGLPKQLISDARLDGIDLVNFDSSIIYYVLKEIEKICTEFSEQFGIGDSGTGNLVVSICFDAPAPARKDLDEAYKSNRTHNKLTEDDFLRIDIIKEICKLCGYNTYYREATEADDIVYNLVRQNKLKFKFTVVVTPDADLLINVQEGVGISRYKSGKGYTAVARGNFESYCTEEYKCRIPYNAILLYKSLCGDKSDLIKGIRGFGAKSFDKYIVYLDTLGIDYKKLSNTDSVRKLLQDTASYFGDSKKLDDALHSLDLVSPNIFDLSSPVRKTIKDMRKEVYIKFGMPSLCK